MWSVAPSEKKPLDRKQKAKKKETEIEFQNAPGQTNKKNIKKLFAVLVDGAKN